MNRILESNLQRRCARTPFHPALPRDRHLELPHRQPRFGFVHQPRNRLERGPAVGAGGSDEDADLTGEDPSGAVRQHDARDLPTRSGFGGELRHDLVAERRVRLVLQSQNF